MVLQHSILAAGAYVLDTRFNMFGAPDKCRLQAFAVFQRRHAHPSISVDNSAAERVYDVLNEEFRYRDDSPVAAKRPYDRPAAILDRASAQPPRRIARRRHLARRFPRLPRLCRLQDRDREAAGRRPDGHWPRGFERYRPDCLPDPFHFRRCGVQSGFLPAVGHCSLSDNYLRPNSFSMSA